MSLLSTGLPEDFTSPKNIAILTKIGIPKSINSPISPTVPNPNNTAFLKFLLSSSLVNLLMLKFYHIGYCAERSRSAEVAQG